MCSDQVSFLLPFALVGAFLHDSTTAEEIKFQNLRIFKIKFK
jgi:hypothetical protein